MTAVAEMVEYLKDVEEQVSLWPGVSVEPHHSRGWVFRIGRSEVGHFDEEGKFTIPFPRIFHNELLSQGWVEDHQGGNDSNWVTFRVQGYEDASRAIWLLRLSYLRYVLKAVPDPNKRFQEESERLNLNPRMKALLQRFVPKAARRAA